MLPAGCLYLILIMYIVLCPNKQFSTLVSVSNLHVAPHWKFACKPLKIYTYRELLNTLYRSMNKTAIKNASSRLSIFDCKYVNRWISQLVFSTLVSVSNLHVTSRPPHRKFACEPSQQFSNPQKIFNPFSGRLKRLISGDYLAEKKSLLTSFSSFLVMADFL